MADEAAEKKKAEPEKKSGGLSIKTIGIIAVLMIVEAAAVFFIVSATFRKPKDAAATQVHGEEEAKLDALVELPLVEDRFQNMQSGIVWIWDVGVYIKVRKRDEEKVNEILQARSAEIKTGIALIVRRAQHSALKEPGLETLNREITAFVNGIVEPSPDGTSRIERVLIPRCRGFPTG